MISGPSPRLSSILACLPLPGSAPSALEVGCGAFPAARGLAGVLPGWAFYGIDCDGAALRYARCDAPLLCLVQADARGLPGLFHACFGLILVRHPDVFHASAAWCAILPALPGLLAPGGVLLITLYAPEEVELITSFGLPPFHRLDESLLVPADLSGRDRFALIYRDVTIES